MRAEQRPPTAGIVAAVCYLALVALPFLALSGPEAAGIRIYYDYGIAGPHFLSLLAFVGIVLFAAGRQGRTEPDYAAGIAIVLGIVLALLVLGWAIAVPEEVVASLGESDWLEYHRWLVLLSAIGVAASGAWYARSLGAL